MLHLVSSHVTKWPHVSSSQLWSVLYPCWPSLFLLLWACIIWIIPRVNPRVSLYYTSPFLVFYTMGLLCLQYVYSLDGPNFPSNGSSIVIRPHVEDRSLQLGLEVGEQLKVGPLKGPCNVPPLLLPSSLPPFLPLLIMLPPFSNLHCVGLSNMSTVLTNCIQ